jgi:hypothetical protein
VEIPFLDFSITQFKIVPVRSKLLNQKRISIWTCSEDPFERAGAWKFDKNTNQGQVLRKVRKESLILSPLLLFLSPFAPLYVLLLVLYPSH